MTKISSIEIPTFEEISEKEIVAVKASTEFENLREKLRGKEIAEINASRRFGKSRINNALAYYEVLKICIASGFITEEQAQKLWKERILSE